jgi:hypothetical protein
MTLRRVFWWLDTRLRLRVRWEYALLALAGWLPGRVKRSVIVVAAVDARSPSRGGRVEPDGYCGPDGLTYADLWKAAGR